MTERRTNMRTEKLIPEQPRPTPEEQAKRMFSAIKGRKKWYIKAARAAGVAALARL